MDPFKIVPPYEMWNAILDKLDDPKDKLNLVRTNSSLESAFRPKITHWQFLAIIPIMASHDRKYGHLNSVIRKSRQISPECCKAVDKYINNHWQQFGTPPNFTNCKYDLYEPDQFKTLCREVENHPPHRSPLLSKSLDFCWIDGNDRDDDDGAIMMNLTRNFLTNFGTHLKKMTLLIWFGTEGERHYRFIRDLLLLTPNIEFLILDFPHFELNEEIVLPPLVNLQRLEVEMINLSEFEGHWLNFQQCFSHLSELHFNFDSWEEHYNVKGLFPKLKRFYLYSFAIFGTEKSIYKFFKHLDAPKLEYLTVEYLENIAWDLTEEQTKEQKTTTNFLKETGYCFLRNLRPECDWIVSEVRLEEDPAFITECTFSASLRNEVN